MVHFNETLGFLLHFFSFLNGKEEATEPSCPACSMDEKVEIYLKRIGERCEFPHTCGRINSEDAGVCGFPTLLCALARLSGKVGTLDRRGGRGRR